MIHPKHPERHDPFDVIKAGMSDIGTIINDKIDCTLKADK